MRFLFLFSFLLFLKCGWSPSSESTSAAQESADVQRDTVAATIVEREPEPLAESVVVEEKKEVLRIWEREWPEIEERKSQIIPAMTAGGIVLERAFVTDTVNLEPETETGSRTDAIFVGLIDFADGKNLDVNRTINNQLMSSIVERPPGKGTATQRLRAAARRATRDAESKQLDNDEGIYAFRHAVTTTVRQNDESFLVVTLEAYVYNGGASGSFFRDDLSFSTRTGQLVKLEEVILRDQQRAFLEILHTAALADGHDYIQDAADFPMPDNFLFTTEGILFHYPEYSESLMNRWTVELLVPFAEFSKMLTATGKEMMQTQRLNGDPNAQVRSLE